MKYIKVIFKKLHMMICLKKCYKRNVFFETQLIPNELKMQM